MDIGMDFASGDAAGGCLAPDVTRDGLDVYFCTAVNARSINLLNKLLREAAEEALAAVQDVKKALPTSVAKCTVRPKEITLHISSWGGGVHAAMAGVDTIKNLKVPVHTVILGYAASAGTLLSVCGAKRFIHRNAIGLVHELRSTTGWGKMSSLRDEMGNFERMSNHLIRYYVEHTKLTEEELRKMMSRDCEWDAEDCLKHGLVDEIIGRDMASSNGSALT